MDEALSALQLPAALQLRMHEVLQLEPPPLSTMAALLDLLHSLGRSNVAGWSSLGAAQWALQARRDYISEIAVCKVSWRG